jgi:protein ImuA
MSQPSVDILRETIATIENRPKSMTDQSDLSVISNTGSAVSYLENLETGALTEVIPTGYRDRVAALGKVMASLAALTKATDERIIWCQLRDPERLHLHAPGLTAFGIDPSRITKITLLTERDLLWVMEEAVTSSSVGAVAGVLWSEKYYDFTASKRLRMRARETDTAVVMVRSHRANGTTAADHRLSVSTKPSVGALERASAFGLLGDPSWHIDLMKSRHSSPGSHNVSWNSEAVRLNMATTLANRTPREHAPPVSKPVEPIRAAG